MKPPGQFRPGVGRLKRRAEFLKVGKGTRVHLHTLSLQAVRRVGTEPDTAIDSRFGLTVTKKVGNAVERNRIRRRLREALRHAEALSSEAETDYVVVARREALTVPFEQLMADLASSVRRAGGQLRRPREPGKDRRPKGR